ncbi:MAG: hypothetical protein ACKN80_07210, partial [Actinomycetales bacterium]
MRFRKDASDLDERIEIPELLIKTLQSLESESLLVLPGEVIVYESDGLSNFGLVRDGRVSSEELIALIRVVRRTNETHRGSIEIARGPIGEGKR